MITRWTLQRPVTTLMISVMVLLLGGIALSRLTVDLMPNLTYPTVSVITLYRGASPEEVETLITRPLEQTLSSVNGVRRLSSTSAEGSSTVRIRLQWGADIEAAIADMRQAIDKIRRFLPEDIDEPYIRQYDVADRPIVYLGLTSQLPPLELTRIAEKQVLPMIERLHGVARVALRGAVRREIHVELIRSELEARQITVNEVIEALQRENVIHPAGDFEEGHLNLLVESDSKYTRLEEIARTAVRQANGAVVRVGDVARIVDGQERRTEMTRTDGKPAVMVYVFKQTEANTVDVSNRVRATVEQLNQELRGAELTVRLDQSTFIRQAVSNVRNSAFYGMLLACLVLLVFLRSFRSALVVAVSMPLSVMATFVAIYFLGFTLNMVSFGGLALGMGLLVDNSIVVLESIFRKRESGLPRAQAALEGTREVSGAILASTITTLIVFLPLLFIPGMTGLLLHQLAWVVSISLVSSLLVSLTLTPMLTTLWGDTEETSSEVEPRWLTIARMPVEWFHAVTQYCFQGIQDAFAALLRVALRWWPASIFGLAICLALAVGWSPRIGSEFLPSTDEGDLRIDAHMAPGIQLATLNRQAQKVEQAVFEHVPERLVAASFIGDSADDGDQWHRCRFRVQLQPRSQRERSIETIRQRLAESLGPVPGMIMNVRASSQSMLFRSFGNTESQVEVIVRGHDPVVAEKLATEIQTQMEQIPGFVNVQLERQERRAVLLARIDRAKAGLLGVSVQAIAQALEATVRGVDATVFRQEGDEFNVLVRLQPYDRIGQSEIERIGVATASGKLIPLKSVVRFESRNAPLAINRLDQQRMISISADVEDRDLAATIEQLRAWLQTRALPPGYSYQIAGDWEEQQESFHLLRQGFVLALLMMYMVLASQFESLSDPLIIMLTVPLGAIGVIFTLVGTDTTLNVQSFIGIVMLAGIVVNNGIVLVDYAGHLERQQPASTPLQVITEATIRRFRPIIMTTLTTVLAMLPIAMGWGEGGELQAPLARVVIGGLLAGTLTTLIAVPLFYLGLQHLLRGDREIR